MARPYIAALPTAYVMLRILIVLNRLGGLAILALLTATIVAQDWTMTALGIPPASAIRPVLMGLRSIAVLGIVGALFNEIVLKRLVAIIGTVRAGDPFVAANALRLQRIAWALLALQLLSLAIGGIAKAISTPALPIRLDAGFSTSGWLAVLLTFVLARIFAEGAAMRDDLAGTV